MNNNVELFLEKAKKEIFNSEAEMLEFAKKNANIYPSQTKHIKKDLKIEVTLVEKEEWKNPDGKGECYKCDYMLDVLNYGESIFSHMIIDLICVYNGTTPEEDKLNERSCNNVIIS